MGNPFNNLFMPLEWISRMGFRYEILTVDLEFYRHHHTYKFTPVAAVLWKSTALPTREYGSLWMELSNESEEELELLEDEVEK